MPASAWLACAGAGLARGGLSGQGGDLDEVVGENRVPAPDRGSVPAVQAGAGPPVAALEIADPALAARSPLDHAAAAAALLDPPARWLGPGLAGRHARCAAPERAGACRA